MTKNEFVHSLKKVKLVLGNGFDLYCHLETTYNYFFNSDKERYDFIKELAKYYYNIQNGENKNEELKKFWELFEGAYYDFSFWDFWFYFITLQKEKDIDTTKWNWCSIEKELLDFVTISYDKEPKNQEEIASTQDESSDSNDVNNFIVDFLSHKHQKEIDRGDINDPYKFNEILLNELKDFESRFGKYVLGLTKNENEKKAYNEAATKAIQKLCSIYNLVSIDTFNFDEPDLPWVKPIIHHINGDCENPIFGVDSEAITYDSPSFIFTKTSRRMELDMIQSEIDVDNSFENIIIFGHSLDKADYSYFFSLFDKIKITDLSNNSKVVFAYSIYDSNKRNQILDDLRKGIVQLFHDYSIYKFNTENHANRLLDQLTTQRKVMMFDIDSK